MKSRCVTLVTAGAPLATLGSNSGFVVFPGHRGTGIPPSDGFGRQHTPRVTPGGGHTSSPRMAKCKLDGAGARRSSPPDPANLLRAVHCSGYGPEPPADHRTPNTHWEGGGEVEMPKRGGHPGEQVGVTMRFSSEGPECATPPLSPLPYLLSDGCQCHLVSCRLLSVKVSPAHSYERAAHVNECPGEAARPLLSTVGNILFLCANSGRRPSEAPPWRVIPPSPIGCALFGEVPYTNTS